MRISVLSLILSVSLFAEWGSDDSSNLSSIARYTNRFYEGETRSGEYIPGWVDYSKYMVTVGANLSQAKEYRWVSYGETGNSSLEEIDPFSSRNETLFEQNNNMQENKEFYENEIKSYWSSGFNPSHRPEDNYIPDRQILHNPIAGNMFTKNSNDAINNNMGIYSIANSTQTEGIRNQVSTTQSSVMNIFNGSTNQSVINWDFSAFGQMLVDRHVMQTNPFLNLKGTFRIVPIQGDFHYDIWRNYFYRGSVTGMAVRNCVSILIYTAFLFYVLNDLMSIVNA